LGIAEQLAQSDPANAGWQRDLSVSYNKLADVLLSIGERDQAMENYQKSLGIAEQLAQSDPANAGWQRDLSVSYNKLADVLLSIGERDPAMENYQKSLRIFEKLAQSDPVNTGWQTDLVISYYKIGDLLAAGNAKVVGKAKSHFNKALDIVKRLQSQGKLNADQQGWIAALKEEIAKLEGN
jgi:tetratricopeptide (TPR) repeat protein